MCVLIKPPRGLCFAALCRIAVAAISIAAVPTLARAQSADLVLCDRLAADPADPDKPADVKGMPDVAPADIATAIKFCKTASAASRRALYQLGRAYAANRQMPEAIGAWRKAADKGSTSAMVELGVLYGTGAGVARDEDAGAQTVRARRRGRQSAWRYQSRCAFRRRCGVESGAGRGACWQEPPRPMPKRSISSA